MQEIEWHSILRISLQVRFTSCVGVQVRACMRACIRASRYENAIFFVHLNNALDEKQWDR